MNQIKLKKIGSEIVREVSDILENKCRDKLMHTFTITGCDVTNDLSFAKIYFTSFVNIDKKELEHELDEASGFIRHELANRIDIRHTPKLIFKFDESVEYGNHIDSIIEKIHEEDNE